MRVLVTGGTGRIGVRVCQHLAAQGYDVLAIDLKESSSLEGITYTQCDIMNTAALERHLPGCETVIHLAALPSPMTHSGTETFQINVSGTLNVYEAAAKAGIKRIVQASSINAFGCYWGNQEHEPKYLPIDEAHPLFTTDPYSFSKEMVERIAAYYWRREGITSFSLRLPAVWADDHIHSERYQTYRKNTRALIDEFAGQNSHIQKKRLSILKQAAAVYRSDYNFEFPRAGNHEASAYCDDPLWSCYLSDRMNFWAFITLEDTAKAFEKALRTEASGAYPLFVNNHQNWLEYDSQALAKLFFPDVPFKTALHHSDSLVSIDKARALLDFAPEAVFKRFDV